MSESNDRQPDDETFEVVVDDFGARGAGCVRRSEENLLIPGALPGERVRVRLRDGSASDDDSPAVADVVEVAEASPDRRDPMCSRDAVCAGCQLRPLAVAAELRLKAETVRDAVETFGDIPADEQPEVDVITPQPIARGDAFRIRTRLTYRRHGNSFELGLETPRRRPLIPMHDCPALTPPTQRLVETVVESLEKITELPGDVEAGEAMGIDGIRVVSPTHGVGLIDIQTVLDPGAQLDEEVYGEVFGPWLEVLVDEIPANVGVAVSSNAGREYVEEPRRIRIPIGRWEVEVGYDDWVHTTLEPADRVYSRVLKWLDLDGDDRLVDIGCGTGAITLMGSEEATDVVGIDNNPASIEAAEINAIGNGRENTRFIVGGWERVLRDLAMEDEHFTAATIHPADEPLGRRPLAFLDVLGIERLVYLGPSPEAAARDMGRLQKMGWSLDRLAAANIDPASHRTLAVALMKSDRSDDG